MNDCAWWLNLIFMLKFLKFIKSYSILNPARFWEIYTTVLVVNNINNFIGKKSSDGPKLIRIFYIWMDFFTIKY